MKINLNEIKFIYTRSPGPGGQNVNKLETAVLLRFNVLHSSFLTEPIRERLIKLAGKKISREGELLIKASRFRTQERNKQDALQRLQELIERAGKVPKKRKKTKPSLASTEKRLTLKKLHSRTKILRSKNKIENI